MVGEGPAFAASSRLRCATVRRLASNGLTATVSGNKVTIHWKASDAASVLDKAEYSINGGEWLLAEPTTRLTDAREHTYSLTADKPDGEVTIAVRVTDEADNQSVAKIVK